MSEWAPKRFWTQTQTVEVEGGYTVHLDGRTVKTPAKADLIVPTQALADEIATEWDAQEEKIDPLTMPFTRAANAAIDKVIPQKTEVAMMLAEYCGTDLLCYRAAAPQKLVDMQLQAWEPLLAWAKDTYGLSFNLAEGVMHVAQPEDTLERARNIVANQGVYDLTALHELISLSGSFVIGLAAQDAAFDINDLWNASIIDESYQAQTWGADEEAEELLQNKATAFLNAAKLQRLVSGTPA
ncbi:MAG: ATP12 family chaperone protein [Planktomarina sp.]